MMMQALTAFSIVCSSPPVGTPNSPVHLRTIYTFDLARSLYCATAPVYTRAQVPTERCEPATRLVGQSGSTIVIANEPETNTSGRRAISYDSATRTLYQNSGRLACEPLNPGG
jgi:hypothetical protein